MKRVTYLLILLAALGCPIAAAAYTCDVATNTCLPMWTYDESTTYVSGLSLTNLQDALIQWTAGPNSGQVIKGASSPVGGGKAQTATGPIPVAVCSKVTMTSTIVERTTAGGASSPVSFNSLTFDRTVLAGTTTPDPACLNPGLPTNTTVK